MATKISNEFENYADKQRFGIRLNYQFNATKNKYKGKGAGESEKDVFKHCSKRGIKDNPYLCGLKKESENVLVSQKRHKKRSFRTDVHGAISRLVRYATQLLGRRRRSP